MFPMLTPQQQMQQMGLPTGMDILNAGGVPQAPAKPPFLAGQGVLAPEFAALAGTNAIKAQPTGMDLDQLAMIGQALQGLMTKPKPNVQPAPSPVNVGSGTSINAKAALPVGQALLPGLRG